jgi:hypothetical protein
MSTDGYTRITLRIPDALHAKLTAEAARTSKSMNAEIVGRLEDSFSEARKVSSNAVDEAARRIAAAALSYMPEMLRPQAGGGAFDPKVK